MARLKRTSRAEPGIRRIKSGRGFRYVLPDGRTVVDEHTRARIANLAIPPAWTDVWVSTAENGHLQAVGLDAAGRRQYLYHPLWTARRIALTHERCLALGRSLPRARERVRADIRRRTLTRERVLGAAFRVLDQGSMRVGSEAYETFGLATIRREHVDVTGRTVTFRYTGKAGIQHEQRLTDAPLAGVVSQLLGRKDPHPELFAWQVDDRWHDVTSTDVNVHLKELLGGRHSAKDFRTWNATVLMCQLLAIAPPCDGLKRRNLQVREALAEVAQHLGNTVTVTRAHYVNPRVIDLFLDGVTIPATIVPPRRRREPIHPEVEEAVVSMLTSDC